MPVRQAAMIIHDEQLRRALVDPRPVIREQIARVLEVRESQVTFVETGHPLGMVITGTIP